LVDIQKLAPTFSQDPQREITFDAILEAFSYVKLHAVVDPLVEGRVYQKLLRMEGKNSDMISENLLSLSERFPTMSSRSGDGAVEKLAATMQDSELLATEARMKMVNMSAKRASSMSAWHRSARIDHLSSKVRRSARRLGDSSLGEGRELAEALNASTVTAKTSHSSSSASPYASQQRGFSSFDDLIASPALTLGEPASSSSPESATKASQTATHLYESTAGVANISPPSRARELLNSLRAPTASDSMSPRASMTQVSESVDRLDNVSRLRSSGSRSTVGTHPSDASRAQLMRSLQAPTPTREPSIHYVTSSSELSKHVRVFYNFRKWLQAGSQSKSRRVDSTFAVLSSTWSSGIFGLYSHVQATDAVVDGGDGLEITWLKEQITEALAEQVLAACMSQWKIAAGETLRNNRADAHFENSALKNAFENLVMFRYGAQGPHRANSSSTERGSANKRSSSTSTSAKKMLDHFRSVKFDDDEDDDEEAFDFDSGRDGGMPSIHQARSSRSLRSPYFDGDEDEDNDGSSSGHRDKGIESDNDEHDIDADEETELDPRSSYKDFRSLRVSNGPAGSGSGKKHRNDKGSRSVYRLSIDRGSFGSASGERGAPPPEMSFVDLTREKLLFRKMHRRLIKEPRERRSRRDWNERILLEGEERMEMLILRQAFSRIRRYPAEERARETARQIKWHDIWDKPGVLKTIQYIRCPAYVRCFKRMVQYYHDSIPSPSAVPSAVAQERKWTLKFGYRRWRNWLHRRRRGRISHSRKPNKTLIDCISKRLEWTEEYAIEFARNFFRSELRPDGLNATYHKQVNMLAQHVLPQDWASARARPMARRFFKRIRELRMVPVLFFNRFDFEISPGGGHYLQGGTGREIASNNALTAQLGSSLRRPRHRASGGCRLSPFRTTFTSTRDEAIPGIASTVVPFGDDPSLASKRVVQDWRNPRSFIISFCRPSWSMEVLDVTKANLLPRSPLETMRRRQQAVRVVRAMTSEHERSAEGVDESKSLVWRGRGVTALYGNTSYTNSPVRSFGSSIEFEPLRHTISAPACKLALRKWRIQALCLKRLRLVSSKLRATIDVYRQREALQAWHVLQIHLAESRGVLKKRGLARWSHRIKHFVREHVRDEDVRLLRQSRGLKRMFAFLHRLKRFRQSQDEAIKSALTHIWELSASRQAHGDSGKGNRKIDRIMRETSMMTPRQRHAETKAGANNVPFQKKKKVSKRQSAVFTRLSHDHGNNNNSQITGSSYVTMSRSFRHFYERTQKTIDYADTVDCGARHHRRRLCHHALKELLWNHHMEMRTDHVKLVRQHRFFMKYKSAFIEKKRVRLFMFRHFMVMRNKYLTNKYMRLFMEPMLRMLRHGFTQLKNAVDFVNFQGTELVVQNKLFWQRKCFSEMRDNFEANHNARFLWKKRFMRKLRWIVGRRRWVNMEDGPSHRARRFPLMYALNIFGYRMAFARRARMVAENYSRKRLSRKGFAALIVLVSERCVYYRRLFGQLGKEGKDKLTRLTRNAHKKHIALVSKIITQARRDDESRMRVAMDRMVYKDPTALAGSSTSSLLTGGVEILLSQVASFESYLMTKMKKGSLLSQFTEADEECAQGGHDKDEKRPTRDSQVKQVLKSLRRKSVSSAGTNRNSSALHVSFQGLASEGALPPDPKVEIKAKRRASVAKRQTAFQGLHGLFSGMETVQEEEGPTNSGMTLEVSQALRGLHIGREAPSKRRREHDPTSALTRIMHGAQMLELARGRKSSWALQLWRTRVQGVAEIRGFADAMVNRLRSMRAFRQLRLCVRLGYEQKKLLKLRFFFKSKVLMRRLRAQRNFIYTSMAYHEAATVLRAIRKWHGRARVLANIRVKNEAHRHHKRERMFFNALYKWRAITFAMGFAVSLQMQKEEREGEEKNYRERLILQDLQ